MPSASVWDGTHFKHLIDLCYAADDNDSRGRSLEDFVQYMFECFEGIQVLDRDSRMGSQELDLVLWNDRKCDFFESAGAEVLVECKNWNSAVGSAEVAWFLEKMRQRSVSHGFFVTRCGVTGECRDGRDGALDTLYSTLRDGLRPIVLTLDELADAADPADLLQLFKVKVGRLMVRRL